MFFTTVRSHCTVLYLTRNSNPIDYDELVQRERRNIPWNIRKQSRYVDCGRRQMFVREKWRSWWQPESGCSREEEVPSPFYSGSSWAVLKGSPEQCFLCKLKGLSSVLAMQNMKSGTCLWLDSCVPPALLLLKGSHVTRFVNKAQVTPTQSKSGHGASNSYHYIWGDLVLWTCSTVWIKAMRRR